MEIRRVMLVDDEDDIRTIGRVCLESVGGWEVVTASSGTEAIKTASDAQPDLILLDVMMPKMDGPSTLKRLQDDPTTRDVPVIFLTAKVQPREVERYLAIGAAGVISKPFDPMTLPDRIRSIMKR